MHCRPLYNDAAAAAACAARPPAAAADAVDIFTLDRNFYWLDGRRTRRGRALYVR